MLAYFFIGHRALGRALLGPWTRVFREGLVAGLLGARGGGGVVPRLRHRARGPAAHARAAGRRGARGIARPVGLVITLPLVLKYTLIHGAAFVLFGWLAAGLLALADREPRLIFAFVMLFCCFEVFFFALIAILAEWLLETLAWWTILAANLLAAFGDARATSSASTGWPGASSLPRARASRRARRHFVEGQVLVHADVRRAGRARARR